MKPPARQLRELGRGARRSLGQHFLRDPGVAERMAEEAGVGEGSRVLEVGPGLGALSRVLLGRGARLLAVERDRELAAWLRAELPGAEVLEADATRLDWAATCPGGDWLCVSNLPYNAGTAIVSALLDHPRSFRRLVVMLQREVAERAVAGPGGRRRGAWSLEVQARARARLAFRVRPGAFHPPPRVESAVLVLELHPEPRCHGAPWSAFRAVVRAAFAQRRKTLLNALAARYGRERAAAALEAAGVDGRLRAEVLEAEAFAGLARLLGLP